MNDKPALRIIKLNAIIRSENRNPKWTSVHYFLSTADIISHEIPEGKQKEQVKKEYAKITA